MWLWNSCIDSYVWNIAFCLLFMPWFICTRRWFMDKFHANQTSMCLESYQNWVWGWYCETCLSPPVIFLSTVPGRCCFVDLFRYLCFVFVFAYYLVCFLQPCGHMMGKGWPLGSLECDVCLCFVTFSYCVLGQVWFLIVSIPDLCLISYFDKSTSKDITLCLTP